MRTNIDLHPIAMGYTNCDVELDSFSLLCCLDEIGFTYPKTDKYLNVGACRNLREFNEIHDKIYYYMIYDFLRSTYGISVTFFEGESISYNERGVIEKVEIEGMDKESDIYKIISNMVFDNIDVAYKTVAHMIVSDLNWRHIQKKNFSKIK